MVWTNNKISSCWQPYYKWWGLGRKDLEIPLIMWCAGIDLLADCRMVARDAYMGGEMAGGKRSLFSGSRGLFLALTMLFLKISFFGSVWSLARWHGLPSSTPPPISSICACQLLPHHDAFVFTLHWIPRRESTCPMQQYGWDLLSELSNQL